MKKTISSFILLAILAIAFTGCLKDKGFDNHTYGINDPDTQPPGVGFPKGAVAKNDFGLNVSASTQVVTGYVYVNLEAGIPASSDVHITLLNNTTNAGATGLLDKYNAANSTSILPLPTSIYNVATSLTIPAGATSAEVPINVTNTTGLDPNKAYAIGYTISAVDGGYKIADNLKNLLVVFSVKNRLDGIYIVTGAALRFGDAALSGDTGPYSRALATSGPNSVQWVGTVPWANGSGSSLPTGYEPNVTVDPATNLVTSVTAPNGDFMTTPTVRTDIIPGGIQKYDPVTKTLYFEFSYSTPSSRLFTMKCVYSGPR